MLLSDIRNSNEIMKSKVYGCQHNVSYQFKMVYTDNETSVSTTINARYYNPNLYVYNNYVTYEFALSQAAR